MAHLVSVQLPTPQSTSSQSLCLWLACLCSYNIFSLCQLTTLAIHNSLTFSLTAGSKLSFIKMHKGELNTYNASRANKINNSSSLLITNIFHNRLSPGPRTSWPDRFFWVIQFFFLGRSSPFADPLPVDPTLCPNRTFWISVCVPPGEFQLNLRPYDFNSGTGIWQPRCFDGCSRRSTFDFSTTSFRRAKEGSKTSMIAALSRRFS